MVDRRIDHEDVVRQVVTDEAMKTRAAKTNAVIASPSADAASLKVAVDAIRAALTDAGLTK